MTSGNFQFTLDADRGKEVFMEKLSRRPDGTDFRSIINQPLRDEMAELAKQLSVADSDGMYDRRESEPIEMKAGVSDSVSHSETPDLT